ncbi:aromatic amino acid ammonia-lyase [Aspergillus undulatus]|uniref:aromatic amino acid ammonia-lyase n=1 Tax=Aspergillus undulatus TaxID=1810928 RepID=UPI003CCE4F65
MPSKAGYPGHLAVARKHSEDLQRTIRRGKTIIDGQSLGIADVLASSKYGCVPYLTDNVETTAAIDQSVFALKELLNKGEQIYGVNTGFGGSADSRTSQLQALQTAFLQLLHSGILTGPDTEREVHHDNLSMPLDWVKATMIVRANSLARGHSAVSRDCIEAILRLVRLDVTPVVPLRGTISASGDLMTLAYIVGVMEGNPAVFARSSNRNSQIVNAQKALEMHGIPRISLGPKEGLGLANGTAASAALASLVMYKAHSLALLTQVSTGLAVEGLCGSIEGFHSFWGSCRPHEGQTEVAANILLLLGGSRLALRSTGFSSGLAQDRYSIRTASQWIGPQLEDLILADHQISTELNSTTDNPLIDSASQSFYCGGNFQATSVTSAMEKTRLALQMLGRLLFSQCSELINPDLNNGLPANLASDSPSLSFTMKGVDINMAAYMSELAYLANPVSSHVQSAEMHNQGVNSLAFLSARYTMQAADLVCMMGACALYVACQALDLRVLQLIFFQTFHAILYRTITNAFGPALPSNDAYAVSSRLAKAIQTAWPTTSRMDIHDRCLRVVKLAIPTLLEQLGDMDSIQRTRQNKEMDILAAVRKWEHTTAVELEATYHSTRSQFCKAPDTASYLGRGSRIIYQAVREELSVPFHQGFIEQPSGEPGATNTLDGREKKIIGGWISIIYEALCDDKLYGVLLDALQSSTNGN